jgi:hypothetical protein
VTQTIKELSDCASEMKIGYFKFNESVSLRKADVNQCVFDLLENMLDNYGKNIVS